MPVFEFRGVTVATGKPVKGFRDAEHAKALRGVLRKEGVLLTLAKEQSDAAQAKRGQVNLLAWFQRPSANHISIMTRQLATLVRAGVPLVESLAALAEQVETTSLMRILTDVRENVNQGISFSKALSAHPQVFPPLYINMVAAGEESGTLDAVLVRLADFMEAQGRLRGKVSSAFAYPVLMVIVGSVLVGLLMVGVVPKVTSIFESLGKELPIHTQILIWVSGFLSNWWWAIVIVVVGGTVGFQRWRATPAGRLTWDSFVLRTPIFGKLALKVSVARFASTLSTLLSSGVQLLKAMEIGRRVLGNAKLEAAIDQAITSIREGESIAVPLKRSKAFPPMLTHMIAVGEKTGELENMLENVSKAYEADVETQVHTMTALLEPLTIVVMGSAVAFIAWAILSPLMEMNSFFEK